MYLRGLSAVVSPQAALFSLAFRQEQSCFPLPQVGFQMLDYPFVIQAPSVWKFRFQQAHTL